jgi:hypothetical protein
MGISQRVSIHVHKIKILSRYLYRQVNEFAHKIQIICNFSKSGEWGIASGLRPLAIPSLPPNY